MSADSDRFNVNFNIPRAAIQGVWDILAQNRGMTDPAVMISLGSHVETARPFRRADPHLAREDVSVVAEGEGFLVWLTGRLVAAAYCAQQGWAACEKLLRLDLPPGLCWALVWHQQERGPDGPVYTSVLPVNVSSRRPACDGDASYHSPPKGSPEERRATTWHEAGHAVVALELQLPVDWVNISIDADGN